MRTFIESIDLYPEKKDNGRIISTIELRFPVYYDGHEGNEIRIPDKKLVFGMTRNSYKRLMDSGVRIYEYEPGFIHAKMYVNDDAIAMIGTINLDYRSLVHHFENGVWLYKNSAVMDIKHDIIETIDKSIEIKDQFKDTLSNRSIRALVRVFAPML